MNEDLKNSIHDVLCSIYRVKPKECEIEDLVSELPREILAIGELWGYCDTDFRELICKYIMIKRN